MHEFSIVESLVQRILSEVKKQELKKIEAVQFRRGSAFSEPALLQAFEVLTKDTPLEGASLDIEKRKVLNFFDEIAVEAALKLKESAGAEAYAVAAGAGTGIDALRRALAMGIPGAFQIDDPAFTQPVRANLFQSGSDRSAFHLLWTRPIKREGRS